MIRFVYENIPLHFATIDIKFQLIARNKCLASPTNSIILLKDKIFFKVQSITMLARIVRGGKRIPPFDTVAKRCISHLIQCTTITSPPMHSV